MAIDGQPSLGRQQLHLVTATDEQVALLAMEARGSNGPERDPGLDRLLATSGR